MWYFFFIEFEKQLAEAHTYMKTIPVTSLSTKSKAIYDTIPQKLASKSTILFVEDGERIVEGGKRIENAYYILEGQTMVYYASVDGRIYSWLALPARTLMGDLEIFSRKEVYAATTVSKGRTTLLKIPVAELNAEFESNHDFLMQIVYAFANNAIVTTYNIEKTIYKTSLEKTVHFLLGKYAQVTAWPYILPMTRREIAEELGTTVKTVDRNIHGLCDKKLIGLTKGKISISRQQYDLLLDF